MTSPLVDVAWLCDHDSAEVRILDCRYYLTGDRRGADEYARGHIPGAAFADLDRDLAAPKGTGPGRHPLPSADAFADVLARWGVTERTILVAYDDAGGAFAARLWWLLRHFGHTGGRLLDGGLQAWIAAGLPLAEGVETPAPSPRLTLTTRDDTVDSAAVNTLREGATTALIDARATERFEGKVEPIDARAGHIPGACSVPFAGNLIDGRFRSRGDLIARFEAIHPRSITESLLATKTIVAYCGSGVTACHDLVALAIAGRDDALLYPGSWSDWSSDPSRPIATGPEPKI
jgi:thiosulfate/3-mercaptopyruvate sulfurtransferase